MTNGPAQPAGDPPSESLTQPTDGPPNELRSTEILNPDMFPISTARLSELVEQMYRYGWELARSLPGLESPVPIKFVTTVDREHAAVDVRAVIP